MPVNIFHPAMDREHLIPFLYPPVPSSSIIKVFQPTNKENELDYLILMDRRIIALKYNLALFV